MGTALLGFGLSTSASYAVLIPGLLILGLGQGSAFTTMYAAASTECRGRVPGHRVRDGSTGQQIGNAVGLAVLVAIANQGVDGLTGDALRTATTDGLRVAVLLTAGGIIITAALALTARKTPAPALVDAVSN